MSDLPTSVNGCARCGGDHSGIEYRPFRRPVPDVDGDFTYWAPCPETGDPILMRRMDKDAIAQMLSGRIAVAATRFSGSAWEKVPVDALAELLRHPHEPKTWDAVYVYLEAGGPHE